MREALSVDQLQKTVAKPVTGEELDALVAGPLQQRARQRQQRAVGRGDRVEVAVGAHEREQVVKVLLVHRGDVEALRRGSALARRR